VKTITAGIVLCFIVVVGMLTVSAGTINGPRTGTPIAVTGATTAGNCVQFADSSGTIEDAGATCAVGISAPTGPATSASFLRGDMTWSHDLVGPLEIGGDVTIDDAKNFIFNATTGTKIGTATTQKLGFFNATPVVQQTGAINTALSTLGLVTSGTLASSALTGTIPAAWLGTTSTTALAGNKILSGTTGSISGALTAGVCNTGTAAVSGATTSMAVVASPVTYPGDGVTWMAYVSAADTVTVKECGLGVITPTASAFNVRVL
jgi:hypothetical protein